VLDAAEAELASFVRSVPGAGPGVRTSVVVAHPVAAILEAAREWPADLIVLGTHGRSGFERLFLGSVAERVLRKAACPVLTAPRRQEDAPHDATVLFKRILCPVDFSEASLHAVEYALSMAKAADASIVLAHVLEGFEEDTPVTTSFSVPEYRRLREQDAMRSLEKLIPAEASAWSKPERLVTVGKAYREILRLAGERSADLIVMGVHGRNPVDLMLFGSTTYHVVREAACPVLTIRPRTG
jgi:nucleotide-binding universal stress UspA family protein